eukprot:6192203-Pleurochrysis_carterae.AAC.1
MGKGKNGAKERRAQLEMEARRRRSGGGGVDEREEVRRGEEGSAEGGWQVGTEWSKKTSRSETRLREARSS